jgi:hypothetical protein
MSWSRKLSKPLHTVDGKTLRTLADARAYAVTLPEQYNSRRHWQRAAELMLDAAADASSIAAASKQIELALFLDMRLDVKKTLV